MRDMKATARRMVGLYPRRWRDRYETELLATVEQTRIGIRQIIDLLAGAVDARVSRDWSRTAASSTSGGSTVLQRLRACDARGRQATTGEALAGAGLMIVASVMLMAAGRAVESAGAVEAGEVIRNLAFPVAFTVTMPVLFMRGVPPRIQTVLVGFTLAMLTVIGIVSAL